MFWDVLEVECRKQGVLPTPFVKSLGISSGTLENWKKGGEVRSGTLLKIAAALGVTTDYLLTGEQPAPSDGRSNLSEDEERLLSIYRGLPKQQKEICFAYMRGTYDALGRQEAI